MAAHFDTNPTEERQKQVGASFTLYGKIRPLLMAFVDTTFFVQVADFIKLVGELYPCDECREHFQYVLNLCSDINFVLDFF